MLQIEVKNDNFQEQFDLRLFEEIGGNIQEKSILEEIEKKSTLRAFASRANCKQFLTWMTLF